MILKTAPPSLLDATTAIRNRRVEIPATQGMTSTMFSELVSQWRERRFKTKSTAGFYVDAFGKLRPIPGTVANPFPQEPPAKKRKMIPVTIDSLCEDGVDGDVSMLPEEPEVEVEELCVLPQERVRVAGAENVIDDTEIDVFGQAEMAEDAPTDEEVEMGFAVGAE